MAVYDLEEQEKIEVLKAWWKDNGRLVIAAVIAFFLSLAAVQGWKAYQRSQATKAAALYADLLNAEKGNDAKRVRELATEISQKYSGAGYAVLAQLTAAKEAYEAGDKDAAAAALEWVIANARDPAAQDTARLRLAGVYLDKQDFDRALKLLEAKHGAAFAALFADCRGDVLVAQDKPEEARAAYQQALAQSDAQSGYRSLIQLKLDALGGAQ